MNGKIRMVRVLSIAAILIGLCAFGGQPVAAKGRGRDVFVVEPTGGDDTANLQAAFADAIAAGPGSTVKLTSGTFSIGLIEVEGFQGSFVGAGKEETVITTVEDMVCESIWPTLIHFVGEDVPGVDIHIADMSFDITSPSPCQPWINPITPWMGPRTDLAVIIGITGQPLDPSYDWNNPVPDHASSSFEKVGFRGSVLSGYPFFGVTSSIMIGGPSRDGLAQHKPLTGVHTVEGCSVENSFYGIAAYGLSGGSLTIGGSASKGNRFGAAVLGLWVMDNSGLAMEFSYNEMSDVLYRGVLAETTFSPGVNEYPWPSPSTYLISHNEFRATGPVDVVTLWDRAPAWDLPQPKTINAVVSHNEFHLNYTGGDIWGGVLGVFAQDVLVANNKFSGISSAGIYLPAGGSGWTIIGNNVQDLNATLAPIWLGMASSNCTVVGGSNKTNVLDEGTANIVTGVNNMQGNPPGPEIQEAMKRKVEILKQFK